MKKQCLAYTGILLLAVFTPWRIFAASAQAEWKNVRNLPLTQKLLRPGMGTIVNAEIGFIKPDFADEDDLDTSPYEPDNTAWAQITVLLEEGRGLSRFDFILERALRDGAAEQYHCLAVARGDQAYSMKKDAWILKGTSAGGNVQPGASSRKFRMLFPLPKKVKDKEVFTPSVRPPVLRLRMKSLKTVIPPPDLNFRLLPADRPFTPASAIPPEGVYGKPLPPGSVPAAVLRSAAPAPAPAPVQEESSGGDEFPDAFG